MAEGGAKKKILVVGQGISGTMLSWFFEQRQIDCIVIDNNQQQTPSNTAAGLINPVTGRRVVTVWMDEQILPFAEQTYQQMGKFLNVPVLDKTSITDFFPNPFMRESFIKKLQQKAPYIKLEKDEGRFPSYFNYEFGIGTISPAYIVHLQSLLPAWRQYLESKQRLLNENLDRSALTVAADKIIYKDIEADKIIFCDGVEGAENPYFSLLPFALNKGEALIIEAKDLPPNHIYKKSMMLVPFKEPSFFWTGTNYIWDFEDAAPTASFRENSEQVLKSWLKVPFKIVDHKAALRPATIERRPFVGFHPIHKNVGILNGMGTKGCSLAPYFASQLTDHILQQAAIESEADIARHARLLTRP
ncbi:NAD(P)/FAD-dependent oxidoreductase [Niabella insulamsoli]|uniref:NAD(P)/FAD-dependent oxidoreductase n=1 Tax=Niabella insulamsoli TaxID=3144874 RepID=UPI0031FBD90C